MWRRSNPCKIHILFYTIESREYLQEFSNLLLQTSNPCKCILLKKEKKSIHFIIELTFGIIISIMHAHGYHKFVKGLVKYKKHSTWLIMSYYLWKDMQKWWDKTRKINVKTYQNSKLEKNYKSSVKRTSGMLWHIKKLDEKNESYIKTEFCLTHCKEHNVSFLLLMSFLFFEYLF